MNAYMKSLWKEKYFKYTLSKLMVESVYHSYYPKKPFLLTQILFICSILIKRVTTSTLIQSGGCLKVRKLQWASSWVQLMNDWQPQHWPSLTSGGYSGRRRCYSHQPQMWSGTRHMIVRSIESELITVMCFHGSFPWSKVLLFMWSTS